MYLSLDKNIPTAIIIAIIIFFQKFVVPFRSTSVTTLFQDTKSYRALPSLNSSLNGAFVLYAVLVGNGCYLGLQEGI